MKTQTHEVKLLPEYWDAIECGDKNFDVRRDDRGYQRGDTIIFKKVNRDGTGSLYETSWRLPRQISYILTGGQFGIEAGYVVLGLVKP